MTEPFQFKWTGTNRWFGPTPAEHAMDMLRYRAEYAEWSARMKRERSLSASAQKERHLSAYTTDTDLQRPDQPLGEPGKPL